MIHLYMGNTPIESWCHTNFNREYKLAHADAQNWANRFQQPVELWAYEGTKRWKTANTWAPSNPSRYRWGCCREAMSSWRG